MAPSPLSRLSPVATRSEHEHWLTLDMNLVHQKARDAAMNARHREIHIFHRDHGEALHRMLNAVQPGSYIRPHRHLHPPKDEAIVLLQGMAGVAMFDDDGRVNDDNLVLLDRERGTLGMDWRSGVWHAFFALTPDTVVFEVKIGPFEAASDKDYAPWAPPEGTPQGCEYLMELEDRFRRLWNLEPRQWSAA